MVWWWVRVAGGGGGLWRIEVIGEEERDRGGG